MINGNFGGLRLRHWHPCKMHHNMGMGGHVPNLPTSGTCLGWNRETPFFYFLQVLAPVGGRMGRFEIVSSTPLDVIPREMNF